VLDCLKNCRIWQEYSSKIQLKNIQLPDRRRIKSQGRKPFLKLSWSLQPINVWIRLNDMNESFYSHLRRNTSFQFSVEKTIPYGEGYKDGYNLTLKQKWDRKETQKRRTRFTGYMAKDKSRSFLFLYNQKTFNGSFLAFFRKSSWNRTVKGWVSSVTPCCH